MKPENLATTRFAIVLASMMGVIVCGTLASGSASGSLPAILFMLAGFGFAGVLVYYLFVRDDVEDTK